MGLQCVCNTCYKATLEEKHGPHRALLKVNVYDYASVQLHIGKCSQGLLSWLPGKVVRAFCFTLAIQSMPGQHLLLSYLASKKNLLNYTILARTKGKLFFKDSKFE